jgi:hypothetical protein
MLLGNSLVNVFSADPNACNSTIFFLAYVFSRLYLLIVQTFGIYMFHPLFAKSFTLTLIGSLLSIVPFILILCLPPNGSSERDSLRNLIWCIGVLFDFIIFPIFLTMTQRCNSTHRMTIGTWYFYIRCYPFRTKSILRGFSS